VNRASNPLGVPAHQHPNGGGWVADTATVSDEAYVGPTARVFGGYIYGGVIRGGVIFGGAVFGGAVYGGVIHGGYIHGGYIYGGNIYGGNIYGGVINGGVIHGGGIYGGAVFGGDIYGGVIFGGDIYGGVIRDTRDVLTVGPIGSEDQYLTLVRSDTGHHVSIGCWWEPAATIDDIAAEVEECAPEFADEYAELMPMLRRRVDEWNAGAAS